MAIGEELRQQDLDFQRNEIAALHIYSRLAQSTKPDENRRSLEKIAEEELRHSRDWQRHSGRDVPPNRLRVWAYYLIGRILGFTFGIKLMGRGEEDAPESYAKLKGRLDGLVELIREENEHGAALIGLLDEEWLRYAGSIVLGLNDALVELTGALAGLTLALQNTQLVALSGLITGIAAALSMGASEYLSTRSQATERCPLRASLYTGTAYILTALVLILPYLVLENYYACLGLALAAAILIIAGLNYHISVAKDEPSRRRFLEVAGLSLGVANIQLCDRLRHPQPARRGDLI